MFLSTQRFKGRRRIAHLLSLGSLFADMDFYPLKQEDGPELQVHGSRDLIQALLHCNLVDQYCLLIFPVVIGSGKLELPRSRGRVASTPRPLLPL